MKNMIWALLALTVSSLASAGEFVITHHDYSGIWIEYTGYVEMDDHEMLAAIMTAADGDQVFITINSGGGSAYGGIALFWEAERHQNLTTIAGADYGAWSAASMFWMGSPRDWFEGADAKVGVHQAYCNSYYPPGCDLTHFRARYIEALNRAGYQGYIFDHWLTAAQQGYGVSAWALLTDEGWFFHESRLHITYPINPSWTY